MTDSEINKIIAEYIQWKPAIIFRDMTGKPFEGWDIPPDYCRDLNAINEAVKTFFKENNCSDYIDHLENICKTDGWTIMSIEERFKIINATARQRAEAFLKTIGKCKE